MNGQKKMQWKDLEILNKGNRIWVSKKIRIWVSISLLRTRIDWVREGHGWLFINLRNCYWTPDAPEKAARTAKKWMKLSLHAKKIPSFSYRTNHKTRQRSSAFILVVNIFTRTGTETNWFPAIFKRDTQNYGVTTSFLKLPLRSIHNSRCFVCNSFLNASVRTSGLNNPPPPHLTNVVEKRPTNIENHPPTLLELYNQRISI